MDVRKWLETTADRDAPDPNQACFIPDHLQSGLETRSKHQKYRGKRKRPSNGSFISESPSYVDLCHTSRRKQVLKTAGTMRMPRSPSGEYLLEDDSPKKLYEKRPRRKTRHDLYEVKPKRSRKDVETHAHNKSKPKRRKSHRNGGDGARTSGLVQEFHLKTGPKDRRLTLKPAQSAAGLFKHGRASTQVAGCGTGLPDLVFNEMRFLQRPRTGQEMLKPIQDHAQSIRDMSPSREVQISGCFGRTEESSKLTTEVPNQPQVPATHTPPSKRDHKSGQIRDLQKRASSHDESDVLPGELHSHAASQNHIRRVNPSPSRDDTCYTWSASEAFPKAGAVRSQSHSLRPGEDGNESHTRRSSRTRKQVIPMYRRLTYPPGSGTECRPKVRTAKDNLPLTKSGDSKTLPEIHEASQISGTDLPGLQNCTAERPLQPSSRKHSSGDERSKSRSTTIDDDGFRADYRTSDILDVRHDPLRLESIGRVKSPGVPPSPPHEPDATLNTSTPVGRLLRQAQMATAFRSSPVNQYVMRDESVGSRTSLLSHSPKLLSPHGVRAKTGQKHHQDYPREAMHARSHISSTNFPRTDRSPGPDRPPLGVDDYQPVLTSLPPVWAGSRHEELNVANRTSAPAVSAYSAQVNDHRAEHGALTNDCEFAPDINQWQADIFAHDFVPEPQSLHQPYLEDSADFPMYEQSRHGPTSARHESRGLVSYGSTKSLVEDQLRSGGWLGSTSERLHTGARYSLPDDNLAHFWKPQKL